MRQHSHVQLFRHQKRIREHILWLPFDRQHQLKKVQSNESHRHKFVFFSILSSFIRSNQGKDLFIQ